MHDIELKAANTLLEKGISFYIRAPWYLRIFGKKELRLVIRHPFCITLYYISSFYLQMGLDEEKIKSVNYAEGFQYVRDHGHTVNKIIAAAWLNNRFKIKLFAGLIAWYLDNSLTPLKQYTMFKLLTEFSGVSTFMSTIRFAGAMRITAPTSLSPETSGSQDGI